jgi:hypothetical protein
MKQFSKSTKLTLFITGSLIITTVVFGSIYAYKNSVYWKNQYEISNDNSIYYRKKMLQTALKLSNIEIENSYLIDDFEILDSVLTEEFIKTDKLLTQINLYKSTINYLQQKNSELYKNLELFKIHISKLETTILEKEKELQNYAQLIEETFSSQQQTQTNKRFQLLAIEDISQYKLLKFSSKIGFIHRGSFRDTKRAKRTEIIQLCIDVVGKFEFDFGKKNLYLRISDAKGNILPFENHAEAYFNYLGEDILYTQNKQIEFTQKLFPLCIDYRIVNELIAGIYWIDVFCDDIKIGETSFELF